MGVQIPPGTPGQMMYHGETDWLAMEVDDSNPATLVIDPVNGLQVNDNSIGNNQIETISSAGKVGGDALTGLFNIPSGAGAIPLANLDEAPVRGGGGVNATVYNQFPGFDNYHKYNIFLLGKSIQFLWSIRIINAGKNKSPAACLSPCTQSYKCFIYFFGLN